MSTGVSAQAVLQVRFPASDLDGRSSDLKFSLTREEADELFDQLLASRLGRALYPAEPSPDQSGPGAVFVLPILQHQGPDLQTRLQDPLPGQGAELLDPLPGIGSWAHRT